MKRFVSFVVLCLIPAIMCYSQWKRITDLPSSNISSLDLVNGTLYVGYDSVLYRSPDSGLTWNITNPISNSVELIQVVTNFAGKLFIGTGGHGVFISADDGITWQQINTGLNELGAKDISTFVEGQGKLIIGTYGAGTFLLNPDMQSWSSFGNLPLNIAGAVYAMINIGDTVIAGAGVNGYIYRLTPGSSQWDQIGFSGGSTIPAVSFVQLNGILYAGSLFGVWRSSDNGLTWENASNGLSSDGEYFVTAFKNTLYAVARINKATYFYKSTDSGDNWVLDDPILPNYAYAVRVTDSKLFLTSVDGLWYKDIAATTSIEDDKTTPKTFYLSQNYPNPFNPSTIINYQLPNSGITTLKVFDVLGREVETLVNQFQSKGKYTINFNASGLASGVYFYQLHANGYISTKKLVLLK